MFFLILIPWPDLVNEGSKHKRSFLVVLEYSTSFTFRSPTTDNNFQLLIYLLISIFSYVNFAYLTYFLPTVNRMNDRLVRLRDRRLLVVTTLLFQTPPFLTSLFWRVEISKALHSHQASGPWSENGVLENVRKTCWNTRNGGKGWGGVGGNMGCDGVPSRWSGSIWVTWCFRTSSFQDLTFRGITPRPKWASPCLL